MTTGVWEPRKPLSLDPGRLAELAVFGDYPALDDLAGAVADSDVADPGLLAVDTRSWRDYAQKAPADVLVALVRFFTLAEVQLAGWDAADKSPVIPIAQVLRARGEWPADLTRWIRNHSRNRFLPYGSLQDRLSL